MWTRTTRLILQGFRSARLEDLVGDCGLQAELDELAARHCPGERARFHAALYDALAAALLLISLGRRAGFEGMTLPWLFAHSVMSGEARDELRQERLF